MTFARSLVLASMLTACAGASEPPPAPPSTVAAPAADTTNAPGPSVPTGGVTVTAPACGYGGSAPAVTVFVDVATSVPLTGVHVSFTVSHAATGAPGGISQGYEQLSVSPLERGLLDFSTQGTTPFDGSIAAGTTTRLEYFAGLGDDPAHPSAPGALGGPLRVDVVVHTNEGIYTATCDTDQMWPSS